MGWSKSSFYTYTPCLLTSLPCSLSTFFLAMAEVPSSWLLTALHDDLDCSTDAENGIWSAKQHLTQAWSWTFSCLFLYSGGMAHISFTQCCKQAVVNQLYKSSDWPYEHLNLLSEFWIFEYSEFWLALPVPGVCYMRLSWRLSLHALFPHCACLFAEMALLMMVGCRKESPSLHHTSHLKAVPGVPGTKSSQTAGLKLVMRLTTVVCHQGTVDCCWKNILSNRHKATFTGEVWP